MSDSLDLGKLRYLLTLEDEEFASKLSQNDMSMKKFSETASKVGKELTTKVTLPIVALGAASLKMAADFEVSSRKFGKAFSGAEEEASKAVKNLNSQYGISVSESTRLLSNTADLLKGFGATSKQALDTSVSVQQLAASLSAYNGVPVADASFAITKAILGETEGLKSLGVVVSEATIQAKLLEKGQSDLEGSALQLAKSQAILEIAYSQSADAVSSFSQNTDTLSFQTNKLLGDLQDLGVQFGTIMVPIIKDLVAQVSGVVKWFGDLDEETKKTILTVAAVAASIGPLISLIGAVTGAVAGLQVALAFLSANPIVAVIAGISALTIGIIAWSKAAEDARVKELTEEFGDLADATKMTKEEMKDFVQAAGAVDESLQLSAGQSFEDLQYQVGQLAENLGLTEQQVIEIGLHNKDNTEETKRQLTVLLDQVKAENEIAIKKAEQGIKLDGLLEREKYIAKYKEDQLQKETAITQEKQKQADIDAQIKEQNNTLTSLYIKQTEDVRSLNTKKSQGLIDEKQLLEGLLQVYLSYNDAMLTTNKGFDTEDKTKKQLEETTRILALIAELKAKIAAIDEAEQAKKTAEENATATKEWLDKTDALNDSTQDQIEKQRELALEGVETGSALEGAINDYYDKLKEKEAFNEFLNNLNSINTGVGMLGEFFDAIYQTQINSIQGSAQAQIEALDQERIAQEAYNKELQKIKEGTSEYTLETIDKEKIAQQALADETEKINKEAALKKWEIEKQQFESKKITSLATLAIDTATAIMKGYAELGPIGGSLYGGLLLALNIAKAAEILSQSPPPRPQLAEGGIVAARAGGVPITISEKGSPEAVIPLNDKFFERLATADGRSKLGYTGQSNSRDLVLYQIMDSKVISRQVITDINNREGFIYARSIVQ